MCSFLRSSTSIILLIFVVLFVLPNRASAESLQWRASTGFESNNFVSQEIRFAPGAPNVLFVTIRDTLGSSGLYKSTDGGISFDNVFPLAKGRDVNALAISYQNENHVWIGTYEQGVFRSSDGGANWSPSGLTNVTVRTLAIDPKYENILYAGTGENNDGGIFKSLDGGDTWNKVGSPTYGSFNSLGIVVDKINDNVVYAGRQDGLFRSIDGGDKWTNLGLGDTNFTGTVIDISTNQTVYSAVYFGGIYKTTTYGSSWAPVNNGIAANSFVSRLTQDKNGWLYGSRRSSGGGVIRSKNAGEFWEDVGAGSDWANGDNAIYTWGLDVKDGRIAVNVEGKGVYVANTDGTPIESSSPPPSGPNPVVFIPGFGGSWSYKGLIENQATTYADWGLIPKLSDSYYQPLLLTLKSAGLVDNESLFTFAYDYRKSIVESANSLKAFLDEKVSPKNPGKKADIIAHSMGGLVTRYCFEKVGGCSAKINKIITGGTPHRGVVQAYDFWEGGQIDEKDLMIKTAEKLLLHLAGLPKINSKDIVQTNFPGVRDALPIFDFISGRPYSAMSDSGKNPVLTGLVPMSSDFKNALLAFSGDKLKTDSGFTTKNLTAKETLFGLWADGKPNKETKDVGDGTVLKTSSQSEGSGNKFYPLEHKDYFRTAAPLTDILSALNLTGTPITKKKDIAKLLTAYSSANVTVSLTDQKDVIVGDTGDQMRSLFVEEPKAQKYKLTVRGTKAGDFQVYVMVASQTGEPSEKVFSGAIKKGEKKTFNFEM